MTKNKKFSLILTLLLCMLLSFGSLGLMSIGKASADGYPFRYDNSVGDDHKMEKYYTARWQVGQDQRAGDETSGTWSFGKAILHTDSQTYVYEKAEHTDPSLDAGDTARYKAGSGPHQLRYGFDLITDVYSGNTSTAYQSVFAWTAEDKGTVKFTGFFSRKNSEATSNITEMVKSQGVFSDFWIPGINTGGAGNGFTSGEYYTVGMFKYSPNASGSKLTCLNYKSYDSEYVWVVDPTKSYEVEVGDIIFFGVLCTNKGQLSDGWSTATIGLFSSEFTAKTTVQRTLTVNCGANGSVSGITNNQKVNNNTTIDSIKITANTGYVIDTLTWAGSTVSDASGKTAYSLGSKTITADTTLTVTFKKETYKIAVTSDTNQGTVTGITNGETKEYNSTVNVTITPKTGYEVATAKWNGSDITGFNKAGFSFSKTITSASDLVVTYKAIKYALTITNDANKGTVTGATNNTEYNMGQALSITVTPKSGYKIASVKWNGTSVTQGFNEIGFTFTQTMDKASTLEVTYEQVKYSVSFVNDNTKGTITGISNTEYTMGTVLNINVVPKAGYKVQGARWGDAYYTANDPSNMQVSIEVDGAKTFTVEYVVDQTSSGDDTPTQTQKYKISIKFDNTMGTANGSGEYTEGSSYTVTIKPQDGYKIKSVKLNSSSLKVENDKKFTYKGTITGAMSFVVEFEKDPYETTYNEDGYACLNAINGGEYVAIASIAFALAGLVILKLKKKEQ